VAADPQVAGFDIGGTKILGRVLDPADPRRALATSRVDTPRGEAGIVEALGASVADLQRQLADRGLAPLAGVGVGIAGLVDAKGVLRFAPNLPGIVDFDVRTAVAGATGLAVTVDNDANAAAVAEHRVGAGVGASDLVLVTLGTGIGGGVVIDDRLVRGAAGFAGEPGHMVVDPNGPPCPCGRRGCWERFASGSGLGRFGREAAEAGLADRMVALAGGDPDSVRGEHVTRAAADGDPEALAVMRQFAWWVALGISNLENLLDPEVVIIGGGLAEAGDLLLEPTRAAYATLVLGYEHRPPVRILAADLGAEAGAIGAGLLALDQVVRAPVGDGKGFGGTDRRG
jgi:glucokinase